jgi:hypothetical protein
MFEKSHAGVIRLATNVHAASVKSVPYIVFVNHNHPPRWGADKSYSSASSNFSNILLARSSRDLLETMEAIREVGGKFQSLSEPWASMKPTLSRPTA